MTANNEALALAEHAPMLSRTHPFVPVIDLTRCEYASCGDPMLYLMPRNSDYYMYSAPTDSDIYPLTDEGLTQAIDRLMWAN